MRSGPRLPLSMGNSTSLSPILRIAFSGCGVGYFGVTKLKSYACIKKELLYISTTRLISKYHDYSLP